MSAARKTTQCRARTTGKRKFLGTNNPVLLTALVMLLQRARTRDELERIAEGANALDMIAALRRLGLELPCRGVPCFASDGSDVVRDIYSATDADRRAVMAWQPACVADHRMVHQCCLFEDDVYFNDSPPDHVSGSVACMPFTHEHDSMAGSMQ